MSKDNIEPVLQVLRRLHVAARGAAACLFMCYLLFAVYYSYYYYYYYV